MNLFCPTALTFVYLLSKTHRMGGGIGVCKWGLQLWDWFGKMSLGGHGKKIIICDDPCDHWGGEDGGFQGQGEVWEEARGFWSLNLHFLTVNLLKVK